MVQKVSLLVNVLLIVAWLTWIDILEPIFIFGSKLLTKIEIHFF